MPRHEDRHAPEREVVVEAGALVRLLSGIVALLFLGHLAGLVSTHFLGHDHLLGMIPLFHLDREMNVPTLFNVFLFLLNAGLALFVWRSMAPESRNRTVWLVVALVLAYLALDEFAELHERFAAPVRDRFGLTGVLYFAWYVPYALFVAAFAAYVLPAVLRLPTRTRTLFVLAAAVFLGGAVGVEAVSGWRWEYLIDTGRRPDLLYGVLTAVEETMEMGGLVILVAAQASLLRAANGGGALRLAV